MNRYIKNVTTAAIICAKVLSPQAFAENTPEQQEYGIRLGNGLVQLGATRNQESSNRFDLENRLVLNAKLDTPGCDVAYNGLLEIKNADELFNRSTTYLDCDISVGEISLSPGIRTLANQDGLIAKAAALRVHDLPLADYGFIDVYSNEDTMGIHAAIGESVTTPLGNITGELVLIGQQNEQGPSRTNWEVQLMHEKGPFVRYESREGTITAGYQINF